MIIIDCMQNADLDFVYSAIRVVVFALVFVVVMCFKKALRLSDRDALFTGTLGLCVLVASEIYSLAYSLVSPEQYGLQVSDYNDAGSYLFFLAAITLLLLPPLRMERPLRYGVSALSGVIIILTIYSITSNNESLLYITVIATAAVCAALSGWLLYQSRRIKIRLRATCFASSMLFLSILDIAMYLLKYNGNLYLNNLLSPLYLLSYLFIGDGLLRLREEKQNG